MQKILDTGCHAASMAVRSAKVDIVAAYPITPQTSVIEYIAEMVNDGSLDCRFLPVEGEHSAMAACVAASAAGARVFTATSSQGLLYMHEVLHMAGGGRFPLVMANANRAVFPPWSLWVDHSDSIAQRDTGWIQIYTASVQEIYNAVVQAFKIAETAYLPVMVNFDGFVLSHCTSMIQVPDQEVIDAFLPGYEPLWRLDPQNPASFGNVSSTDMYPFYREQLQKALEEAKPIIERVAAEYQAATGMWDGGLFETYRTEDAEVFVMAMGSMAAELKLSVDALRKQGLKIGLLRLRVFRPFPQETLSELLPQKATLVVLDRNYALGLNSGTLMAEAKTALYARGGEIKITGKVVGIGGQDLTWEGMASEITALLEGSVW